MIYQYTENNLLELLQTCGTISREQLLRFFSQELKPERVQGLLNQFEYEQRVRYDPETDMYTYYAYRAPIFKPKFVEKFTKAFWVIAAMGSADVDGISILKYPSQYYVIDHEGAAYDITVVDSVEVAANAERARRFTMVRPDGKEFADDVNHIAIVDNAQMGEIAKNYGFDFYCMLDPKTHLPVYTEL